MITLEQLAEEILQVVIHDNPSYPIHLRHTKGANELLQDPEAVSKLQELCPYAELSLVPDSSAEWQYRANRKGLTNEHKLNYALEELRYLREHIMKIEELLGL